MNVSSNLAGRLGVKGHKGRVGRPGRPSDVISRVPTKAPSVLGGALAHRLGVPMSTVGSSLSVGIKARLGVGARRAVYTKSPAADDHFHSPYPPEKGMSVGAVTAERRRRNIRTADLAARRGIEVGDVARKVLPARVKMSSGRVVGGMRSDLIKEHSIKKRRQRSSSPRQGVRPVVAMDATRGLTVSLQNSRRTAPYSQHDDRALPHAKYSRSLDWESEDDLGLQFQGRRSHRMYGGDAMDVDSGVDVYNASLLFTTRTTTHHHHHHHHGPPSPSPSPPPPPIRPRPALPSRARSPSPLPPYHRPVSPRHTAAAPDRYLRDGHNLPQNELYYSEDYSPPPPPSPPSFHPRYRARGSPSPSGYTAHRATRAAAKPAKSYMKTSKAVKRTKVMKPVKKRKKVKASKNIKGKKPKQLRSNRSSSLDSVNSNSDSSSSSNSSSSSSDSSSSSRNPRPATYKAPKERFLPEPHKQVLDPQVRESIASLQGKDPESKSGPGPGIKDLVFVPSRTGKSLNQRFTFSDNSR
ncbi:hypothetical protein FHG87_017665 [Trinorchestia longiramus]|nr:hypothetical protein FHG87_017665 [Trinorchestia longiramus]